MRQFLAGYEPGQKFNEEFIRLRSGEGALECLDHVARTLEVVPGVEYLGAAVETDESALAPRTREGKKWVPVEESRVDRIVVRFRISGEDPGEPGVRKEEIIEKELLYPKLMEGAYYLLGGVRYFPVWQVTDGETFRTSRGVTLKTMIMPVGLNRRPPGSQPALRLESGEEPEASVYDVRLFEKTVNMLLYPLIAMGLEGTMEWAGFPERSWGVDHQTEWSPRAEAAAGVRLGKDCVLWCEPSLLEDRFRRDVLACLQSLSGGKLTCDKAIDVEHWRRMMGAMFTKNQSALSEKAQKLTVSFRRVMDTLTQGVLRVPEEDKADAYAALRWMCREYDALRRLDNMDLAGKRIRLHEYLVYPLLVKWSAGVYRILNSKQVKYSDLKTLFSTLGPRFLIKALMNNDLLRYSNAVNGMDLFNSVLKFTMRGPQSLAHGSRNISVRYRGLHNSYVGFIGLSTSSNGDPGMSGTFTPFAPFQGRYFSSEAPWITSRSELSARSARGRQEEDDGPPEEGEEE